jgi:hypothetical protein
MIKRVTVSTTPVTVAGATWPVLFTFRGWYPLVQHFGSVADALEALASSDEEAVGRFFWAGLLHDMPDLTLEEATAVLNTARLAELLALPAALAAAIRVAAPTGSGSGGDEWDFKVAEAAWMEWGQDAGKFWDLTFREFSDKCDGRAKLYERAKDGGHGSGSGGQWEGTLEELLNLGRRRKR